MSTIRTFEEFLRHYFPAEVERERVSKLTPQEFGREVGERAASKMLLAARRATTPTTTDREETP